MNVEETVSRADHRIFERLHDSPFFRTYRKAFRDATGFRIELLPVGHGGEGEVVDREANQHENPFCRRINEGGGCDRCRESHCRLARRADGKPTTTTCFAGLQETMAPVRAGERTLAMLSIGEVFTGETPENMPADLVAALEDGGLGIEERASLARSWGETHVVPVERYQGAVTLLAAFALQLGEVLNRLLIEEANAEPEVVVRAKRFVNAHLEEKISLESVARHVGVSPYYFCKVFKQAAGMTLTEFVNRRRVEWAKRKLLNPRARVTEVAFDVGFQSISQFNRSFLKYVGESPTRFRESRESMTRLSEASAA